MILVIWLSIIIPSNENFKKDQKQGSDQTLHRALDSEIWWYWNVVVLANFEYNVSLRFGHPAKLLFPSIENTVTIPYPSYDFDYKRCLQEMDHEGPIFGSWSGKSIIFSALTLI